ncbi:MAG: DHHA1 domain-containing protein, partial [Minisyncoccia bacterium]
YMGMYSDTVGLRISDVTEKTVSAMAQCYPLTNNIQQRIIGSMQNYGRKELDLLSICLSKREYIENEMCLIILPYTDILKLEIEKPTTHFVTGFLAGRMYDAKTLCVVFETTPNNFRVSARSDSAEQDTTYDMNIFMNKLGGGGHKGAAGALVVAETPAEARTQILKAWVDTQK